MASGLGYGVASDAQGRSVEYVGEARSGYASGTGAMIVRGTGFGGATYYEGRFQDGVPNGSVLVEAPGQPPRWRDFTAGQDQGRANPGALADFGFNGSAGSASLLNP